MESVLAHVRSLTRRARGRSRVPSQDGGSRSADPSGPPSPAEPGSDAAETDADGHGNVEDSAGIDYAWVMQVTFVATIVVGAPVVALLAVGVSLPTWESRVSFAVRVGAVVWILTAVTVLAYARHRDAGTQ